MPCPAAALLRHLLVEHLPPHVHPPRSQPALDGASHRTRPVWRHVEGLAGGGRTAASADLGLRHRLGVVQGGWATPANEALVIYHGNICYFMSMKNASDDLNGMVNRCTCIQRPTQPPTATCTASSVAAACTSWPRTAPSTRPAPRRWPGARL